MDETLRQGLEEMLQLERELELFSNADTDVPDLLEEWNFLRMVVCDRLADIGEVS